MGGSARLLGGLRLGELPDRVEQQLRALELREVTSVGQDPETSARDRGGKGTAVVGLGDAVGR